MVIVLTVGLSFTATSTAHADAPRPRVGLGVAAGGFAGTVSGIYGGVQGRLGVQWNDGFATYLQSQGLLGTIGPDRGAGAMSGAMLNTAMFEGTIGKHVQIGIGPGLDFVWGCRSDQHPDVCNAVGPFFSLDGRVALRLAPLTVSLDVHPTWLARNAVATYVTLGVGVDF